MFSMELMHFLKYLNCKSAGFACYLYLEAFLFNLKAAFEVGCCRGGVVSVGIVAGVIFVEWLLKWDRSVQKQCWLISSLAGEVDSFLFTKVLLWVRLVPWGKATHKMKKRWNLSASGWVNGDVLEVFSASQEDSCLPSLKCLHSEEFVVIFGVTLEFPCVPADIHSRSGSWNQSEHVQSSGLLIFVLTHLNFRSLRSFWWEMAPGTRHEVPMDRI